MITELNLESLCETLKRYRDKRVILTFHSIGDRDSVSSAIALSKFFKDAKVGMPDFITNNARHMLDKAQDQKKIIRLSKPTADLIIACDTNSFDYFGKLNREMASFKGQFMFIDHHAQHEISQRDVLMFNSEAYNSTASIVHEVLKRLGVRIDKETAILLLNGIVSDSAEFRNAMPLTFKQISELLEIAEMDFADVLEYFHENVSVKSRIELLDDLKVARSEAVGGYMLAYGQTTLHANVVADTMIKLGADAAVFWEIGAEEVSISARLRPPLDRIRSIHLGLITQGVKDILGGNGGGHPCAAGAYGPNRERSEEAVNKIINEIRKKFAG